MRHRIALPLMVLAAAAMIALALVWPQGIGRPSPAPFGHPLAKPVPAVRVDGHTLSDLRGAAKPDVPAPPKRP